MPAFAFAFSPIAAPANSAALGIPFTYWAASDAPPPGDGTQLAPYAALTSLPALMAGDWVGLKYGSAWGAGETIESDEDGILIDAWGISAAGWPALDAEGSYATCMVLSGANAILRHFQAKGATGNDGCIVLSGDNALGEDILAEDGALHVLLLNNGILRRAVVRNGSGISLLELFSNLPGREVLLDHVDTYMDVYDPDMAGIDGHTSAPEIRYAKVTILGGETRNVGGGISLSDVDELIVRDRPFDNVSIPFTIRQDSDLSDITDVNGPAGGRFMNITEPDVSVTLAASVITRSLFNTAMLLCGQPGLAFLFKGPLVISAPEFSPFAFGFFDYGDIQFGEVGDEIYFDAENIPYAFINGRGDGSSTLTTPANYTLSSWSFAVELNGNTYSGQSAIQGAGLFLNATIGPPPDAPGP